MNKPRCPGQDMRYLKPEDVYNVRCPRCKAEVEFFKDEPVQRCPACRREVRNPKIDLGCAKWCAYAEQCLGELAGTADVVEPVENRLVRELNQVFAHDRTPVRSHTMLKQIYPLPSAERQPAIDERNRQMGLRQRRADVCRHVVIAFGGMPVQRGVVRH